MRCNRAKQGLCTVIHMVCGFMRGQMVPLKQEVIDIMTWPTVECGCMCVCVCVSKDTSLKWIQRNTLLFLCVFDIQDLHFCLHVDTSSDN